MKLFSSLKQQATSFLEQYKQQSPATYAAAEQAVGAVLITDGLIGIDSPLGGNKRPGIFGTLGGITMGIIFLLIPTFFGNISGTNNMTATTTATVVSVGENTSTANDGGSTCSLTVSYNVAGTEYTKGSSMSSSSNCSLSTGQTVTINYNPNEPGSWAYDVKTVSLFLMIFFWAGVFVIITSAFTFAIRLISIIFGWKLLREGRKLAAGLPEDTNFKTIMEEIKKNFVGSVFNFGGTGITTPPVTPPPVPTTPTAPETPEINSTPSTESIAPDLSQTPGPDNK
ncbi:MAG: DUF3592 domain-containing protein [bacterium]